MPGKNLAPGFAEKLKIFVDLFLYDIDRRAEKDYNPSLAACEVKDMIR